MKLRVKMTIAVATALLMSPILVTPASATSTLDQSTAGDPMAGGMWYGITDGAQFYRQSFTAGLSGPLVKITMHLKKFGSPTSVTVDVKAADSSGNPTGSILASRILPGSALSDDGGDVEVIFADPPSVTAGSRYVVTLSSCVGCGGGGDLSWFASVGNPYAGGFAYEAWDGYSGPTAEFEDFVLATYVGPAAFSGVVNCPGGGTYTIEAGVITGNTDCAGAVSLSSGATSMANGAFARSAVTSVVIPSSITAIPYEAFLLSALTSVTIPEGVLTIGGRAFNTSQLTTVVIPNSVTSLGSAAFAYSRLTSATIGSGVTVIPELLFIESTALSSVTIQGAVTEIGNSAFQYTNLGSYVVPSSVTTIGNGAFNASGLTSITLPTGLTTIEANSLESNPSLAAVVYCGPNSSLLTPLNLSVAPICAQVPDAPTITSVTATGADTATVSFTAPANNGAAITSYRAVSSPEGVTGSVSQSESGSIVVSGLQPNTSYTFTLTASNVVGRSASSSSSDSVTTLRQGLVPVFASPVSTSSGFTVQVTNFDAAWEWAVSATQGSASINGTGAVTVTGLSAYQSSTVTVTTTRTGYAGVSATTSGSQAASPDGSSESSGSNSPDQGSGVSTPPSGTQVATQTPSANVTTNTAAVTSTPTKPTATINKSTVKNFTKNQIARWTGADISRINATVFAMLSPMQVKAISPKALSSLKPSQFASLKVKQLAALSPTQIVALPPSVFTRASRQMLGALSPAAVTALTLDQINALPKKSVWGVSKVGYARMTWAQQRAMKLAAGWRVQTLAVPTYVGKRDFA